MRASVPVKSEGFGAAEWAALTAYVTLVAAEARHHLSWADEAQAWLIARDCSLREIFQHRLHYEGTPGLWHLLVWAMVRMHLPFAAMHWVGAGIAVAGVAVWLRYSPMPRYLKLLFPFTFFMAYQYAVVARSYVLFPLLTFSACALIGSLDEERERRPRPLLMALLLALLANLCMYGTACAAGLAVVYAERIRRRKWAVKEPCLRGRCAVAAAILVVACGLAAATAWPAKDVAFTTGIMDLPSVQKILHRAEPAAAADTGQPSWLANPADERLTAPRTGSRWKDALWRASHKFYNGSMQQTRHVYRTERLIFAISLLMFPLAGQMWLAYLAVAALIYRCVWRKTAVSALPFALMFLASILIYAAEHHSGLLLVALVAVAWITWSRRLPLRTTPQWIEIALRASLLAIFVLQAGWTWHAMRAERQTAYAGDRAAADYLHEHAMGKRVAGYYAMSIGPEAYFGQKIYYNQPTSYWQFSKDPRLTLSNEQVLSGRPDFVVLGTLSFRHQMILNQLLPMLDTENEEPGDILHVEDFYAAHGFRETRRFCGLAPMRGGFSSELCQIVLEPASQE